MIRVIYDIEQFFKSDGKLFIYGAGHYGQLLGQYMNKLRIPYDGYLDEKWGGEKGILCKDHQVSITKKLYDYPGENLRIVVAIRNYSDALTTLYSLADERVSMLCLIPIRKSFVSGKREYMINRLLGYFRGKLISKNTPTIIGNDCIGGRFYEAIGRSEEIIMTPTINTFIEAYDFIKLAMNPKHYLSVPIEYKAMEIRECESCPCGLIDDVKVYFTHGIRKADVSKCIERWNRSLELINWNNLVFVIRENATLPYDFGSLMKKCEYPYLIIRTKSDIGKDLDEHSIYAPKFIGVEEPYEDYFDFVGWWNKTFKANDNYNTVG